jgi:hypothetical protein
MASDKKTQGDPRSSFSITPSTLRKEEKKKGQVDPATLPKSRGLKVSRLPGTLRSKTFSAFFDRHRAMLRDPQVSSETLQASRDVMGSLIDPTVIYRFRLASDVNSMSATSGLLAQTESVDPSGGSPSTWTALEWSEITALFQFVRAVQFKIHFSWASTAPAINEGSYMVIASTLNDSATPVSAISVVNVPNSIMLNPHNTSGSGRHTQTLDLPISNIEFADVGTPNPGGYAGCPGTIIWYGGGFAGSDVVGYFFREGIYEFRARK